MADLAHRGRISRNIPTQSSEARKTERLDTECLRGAGKFRPARRRSALQGNLRQACGLGRRRLCRPASSDRMPSAWRYHPIRTEEASMAQQQAATPQKEGPLAHVLPPLPYAPDALEPYIDKLTMEIHHGKHHGAYVNNLNKALEGHADLQTLAIDELMKSLDRVPEAIRTAVRNNGGGHWNHSMFWKIMKKGGGGEPTGAFADALKASFGSFADFKGKFAQAGVG